jgi:hypothetical protein
MPGLRGTMQKIATAAALALFVIGAAAGCRVPRLPPPPPKPTIADRVAQYGPAARTRLIPHFAAAGVPYPPERFLLLGLKRERVLQLYATADDRRWAYIRSFAIYGASGDLGPKRREGDRQVPEGIYRIAYLNPNSISHLSLALSYPNSFDRAYAEEDGRDSSTLGGDIMIHGGAGSIGCLAIGDQAVEDLFILAADSDWQRALVVVSPLDFRRTGPPAETLPADAWVERLYVWLRGELRALPLPLDGAKPAQ